MNRILTIAATAALISAFSGSFVEAKTEEAKAPEAKKESAKQQKHYTEITSDALKTMLDAEKESKKGELVLIDARDEKSFKEGHIESAINMRPDAVNKESLAKLAKSVDTKLVFYCANVECPASSKAANKAAELGYKNIYKFTGGIAAWKTSGYEVKS